MPKLEMTVQCHTRRANPRCKVKAHANRAQFQVTLLTDLPDFNTWKPEVLFVFLACWNHNKQTNNTQKQLCNSSPKRNWNTFYIDTRGERRKTRAPQPAGSAEHCCLIFATFFMCCLGNHSLRLALGYNSRAHDAHSRHVPDTHHNATHLTDTSAHPRSALGSTYCLESQEPKE